MKYGQPSDSIGQRLVFAGQHRLLSYMFNVVITVNTAEATSNKHCVNSTFRLRDHGNYKMLSQFSHLLPHVRGTLTICPFDLILT